MPRTLTWLRWITLPVCCVVVATMWAEEKAEPKLTLSKEEQEVLDLTNKERKAENLPPLKPNARLFKAAREHSKNMAKQDILAHTLDDKDPGDRLNDVGYKSTGWGENCAAGQRTPAEALESWMNSEGHRANILGDRTEIGIGVAETTDGKRYWTQVFATPARE